MRNELRAGMAQVDITPPLGVSSSCNRQWARIARIHDNLYAKALVMDNGRQTAAIVCCDLLGTLRKNVLRIRKLASKQTGIKEENISVCSTHSHSTPGTVLSIPKHIDKEYMKSMEEKAADAILRAWRNVKEVRIGLGKGKCAINVNRGYTKDCFGKTVMYNPAGPVDREVGVIKIEDDRGNLTGLLCNYTCHLVTYGNIVDSVISADMAGYVARKINEAHKREDIITIFTNGAAGNINPLIMSDSYRVAEDLGSKLAAEILKTCKKITTRPETGLEVKHEILSLPLVKLPSAEEARRIVEKKRKEFYRNKQKLLLSLGQDEFRSKFSFLRHARELLLLSKSGKKEQEVEVQVMKIGGAVLVCLPVELFVEFGLEIKKKSRYDNTFIVGYSNGWEGYIFTKEALKNKNHYGSDTITRWNKFQPDAGRRIVKSALKLLA